MVTRFIRFFNHLATSSNYVVNFIARVSMFNQMSYIRRNILYIKWKYEIDITNTCIHECINSVHTISKTNELIMSHVDMLHELIDTRDGFSTIGSLDKNEITDFIISVSTIEFN